MKAAARTKRQDLDQGIILMYHRVAAEECDPWSLSVSPQHFEDHLEVLQRLAHPLHLRDVGRCGDFGNLPSPWVAITFDDGYVDNLHRAAPILRRFQMPATFFLVTNYLGSKRGFWWDQLGQILLVPGTLPPMRALQLNGRPHDIGWAAQHSYSEAECSRDKNWRVGDPDPSPRHTLYRTLHGLLRPQSDKERQEVLDQLWIWSGRAGIEESDQQVLSAEDIVDLDRDGLFESGAHTVTHCDLASLPRGQQWEEILEGKRVLEKVLGHPVICFAYPYGAPINYTKETASLVREAGFACAVTTNEGLVQTGTDRYELPRVHVQDWPADEFEDRISRHLGVERAASSPGRG